MLLAHGADPRAAASKKGTARHRRSPAQARDDNGRGAQRERGMRDVGKGNGNGNGNWKGDDPQ